MTAQRLATLAFAHFAAGMGFLLALLALCLRDLVVEVSDDVRASRNETKRISGGTMQPRNRRIRDYDSTLALKAVNDALEARNAGTPLAVACLSDARQLAAEVAMARRAS